MAGFFLEGFLRLHFSNAWSDIKAFKDGRNIALHFQLGFEGKEQWLTFFIIIEVHIWQFRKGLRQGKFVKRRTNLWLDFFLKVSNAYKIMWSGEADTADIRHLHQPRQWPSLWNISPIYGTLRYMEIDHRGTALIKCPRNKIPNKRSTKMCPPKKMTNQTSTKKCPPKKMTNATSTK